MSRVRNRKDKRVPPDTAAAFAGAGDTFPAKVPYTTAEVIELRGIAQKIKVGHKELEREFIEKLDAHNFYAGYKFDDLVAWYEHKPDPDVDSEQTVRHLHLTAKSAV